MDIQFIEHEIYNPLVYVQRIATIMSCRRLVLQDFSVHFFFINAIMQTESFNHYKNKQLRQQKKHKMAYI